MKDFIIGFPGSSGGSADISGLTRAINAGTGITLTETANADGTKNYTINSSSGDSVILTTDTTNDFQGIEIQPDPTRTNSFKITLPQATYEKIKELADAKDLDDASKAKTFLDLLEDEFVTKKQFQEGLLEALPDYTQYYTKTEIDNGDNTFRFRDWGVNGEIITRFPEFVTAGKLDLNKMYKQGFYSFTGAWARDTLLNKPLEGIFPGKLTILSSDDPANNIYYVYQNIEYFSSNGPVIYSRQLTRSSTSSPFTATEWRIVNQNIDTTLLPKSITIDNNDITTILNSFSGLENGSYKVTITDNTFVEYVSSDYTNRNIQLNNVVIKKISETSVPIITMRLVIPDLNIVLKRAKTDDTWEPLYFNETRDISINDIKDKDFITRAQLVEGLPPIDTGEIPSITASSILEIPVKILEIKDTLNQASPFENNPGNNFIFLSLPSGFLLNNGDTIISGYFELYYINDESLGLRNNNLGIGFSLQGGVWTYDATNIISQYYLSNYYNKTEVDNLISSSGGGGSGGSGGSEEIIWFQSSSTTNVNRNSGDTTALNLTNRIFQQTPAININFDKYFQYNSGQTKLDIKPGFEDKTIILNIEMIFNQSNVSNSIFTFGFAKPISMSGDTTQYANVDVWENVTSNIANIQPNNLKNEVMSINLFVAQGTNELRTNGIKFFVANRSNQQLSLSNVRFKITGSVL